jgi:hypothetical protein
MVPISNKKGNLPPGIHLAQWGEIEQRYGYNQHRQKLLGGLRAAIENLRAAGCLRVYIDGSFVSSKPVPADFELCWEPKGVDRDVLDPLFNLAIHALPPRLKQKEKYCGEVILTVPNPAIFDHLSYFQFDDRTGDQKGIIALDLDTLT